VASGKKVSGKRKADKARGSRRGKRATAVGSTSADRLAEISRTLTASLRELAETYKAGDFPEAQRCWFAMLAMIAVTDALQQPGVRSDAWLHSITKTSPVRLAKDDQRGQLLANLEEYLETRDLGAFRLALRSDTLIIAFPANEKSLAMSIDKLPDERLRSALRRLRALRNLESTAARLALAAEWDPRVGDETDQQARKRLIGKFRAARKRWIGKWLEPKSVPG
jgi:hypothetical protein